MVALNSAQYGGGYPGPQCFKWITVSHNGQQRQAQVLDECPTCEWVYSARTDLQAPTDSWTSVLGSSTPLA